jgi:hypothetical protein
MLAVAERGSLETVPLEPRAWVEQVELVAVVVAVCTMVLAVVAVVSAQY